MPNIDTKQMAEDISVNIEFLTSLDSGDYTQPHRHDYFELLWTLEGSGSHSIDFIEYPLKAGQIYMITPGQVHDSTPYQSDPALLPSNPMR